MVVSMYRGLCNYVVYVNINGSLPRRSEAEIHFSQGLEKLW